MRTKPIPLMPEGFTDRAAWDAIHWEFSEELGFSILDDAVATWQRENQDRVMAAINAIPPVQGKLPL